MVNSNFNIVDLRIPIGNYNNSEFQLVFSTNKNKKISFSSRSTIGGYFGGNKLSSNLSLDVRSGDSFSSSLGFNINRINIDDGQLNALLNAFSAKFCEYSSDIII